MCGPCCRVPDRWHCEGNTFAIRSRHTKHFQFLGTLPLRPWKLLLRPYESWQASFLWPHVCPSRTYERKFSSEITRVVRVVFQVSDCLNFGPPRRCIFAGVFLCKGETFFLQRGPPADATASPIECGDTYHKQIQTFLLLLLVCFVHSKVGVFIGM